jgi:hypothetical protein
MSFKTLKISIFCRYSFVLNAMREDSADVLEITSNRALGINAINSNKI